MSKARRLAGYKLAGLPVTNVAPDIKAALDAAQELRRQRRGQGLESIEKEFVVPGTGGRTVDLSASAYGASIPRLKEGDELYGRSEDILTMLDPDSPGVYSLAWSTGGDYYGGGGTLSDQQQQRIAREAARRWPEVIKEMPEGAIVTNSPVGAYEGDFERADLYSRYGFGPVQTDGSQYGVIRGGRIQPLSPYIPMPEHASHLAARAEAAGDPELADMIRNELLKRQEEKLYDRTDHRQYDSGYDDYDDYDPYEDESDPLTRAQLANRAEIVKRNGRFGFGGGSEDAIGVPEIGIRRALEFERGTDRRPTSYQPTPADIQELRDEQIRLMGLPTAERDLLDRAVQQFPPRQPRETGMRTTGRSGIEDNREPLPGYGTPAAQRIRMGRDLQDQLIDPRGVTQDLDYESGSYTPEQMRRDAKGRFVEISEDARLGGRGLIAQEMYSLENLELLRDIQATVNQNDFQTRGTARVGPPTLDAQGRVISRPEPPAGYDIAAERNYREALRNDLDNVNRPPLNERLGYDVPLQTQVWNSRRFADDDVNVETVPQMVPIEWRRQLTPEQVQAQRSIDLRLNPGSTRGLYGGAQATLARLNRSLMENPNVSSVLGAESLNELIRNYGVQPNITRVYDNLDLAGRDDATMVNDRAIINRAIQAPNYITSPNTSDTALGVAQAAVNLRNALASSANPLMWRDNQTLESARYGPGSRVTAGPSTVLTEAELLGYVPEPRQSDIRLDIQERQAREARARESGERPTRPRRRNRVVQPPTGAQSVDPQSTYEQAPADMSMDEFLAWEKEKDFITDYSLTPEQRYNIREEVIGRERGTWGLDDRLASSGLSAPAVVPASVGGGPTVGNALAREQQIQQNAANFEERIRQLTGNLSGTISEADLYGVRTSPSTAVSQERSRRTTQPALQRAVRPRDWDPERPRTRQYETAGFDDYDEIPF